MNMTGLRGVTIAALDGCIGVLEDLYVDGHYWTVRYLVAGGADGMPAAYRVWLPVQRIVPVRRSARAIEMALTREEARRRAAAVMDDAVREPWLCSGRKLVGSDVAAADGACGRIRDLVIDEPRWVLRGMVVDIRRPGGQAAVLVAPGDVEQVDRERRVVRIRRTRAQVARLPAAGAL